jgi:hypothetical protein
MSVLLPSSKARYRATVMPVEPKPDRGDDFEIIEEIIERAPVRRPLDVSHSISEHLDTPHR